MDKKQVYTWDHFSDQPHVIKRKKTKRLLYRKAIWNFLSALWLVPFIPFFLLVALLKPSTHYGKVGKLLGLAVHVESECKNKTVVPNGQVIEMLDELGIKQVHTRIPLAKYDDLPRYLAHIDRLQTNDREVSVVLLQDREHIEKVELYEQRLAHVLSELDARGITHVQIGNAINRRKWAFHHLGEYLKFFRRSQQVSKKVSPKIQLLGGAIIDFEFWQVMEILFHFRRCRYDGLALQLYVDRRGAPENRQMGFSFLKKIDLMHLLNLCSPKSKNSLWITEINWPLSRTAPFAPCCEKNTVDEKRQADYLVRSYLIAMASGKLRTCYWHQLVAPGFGLVDNRGDSVRKRPSYWAFAALNRMLPPEAEIVSFGCRSGLYSLEAVSMYEEKPCKLIAYWTNDRELEQQLPEADVWLSQDGAVSDGASDTQKVSGSVLYAVSFIA